MNRLANESSPYLRQHADNPVDWWPWTEEAFDRALELDRPVFLSVGYSACHWCHVMAHESFEDPETAALLNDRFISIKVDREERPDVDAVYMEAVQALTGQGGWPMSVFCAPDGRPFQGGTYFPKEQRHGLPSFRQVLLTIDQAWHQRRESVLVQAADVAQAIKERSQLPPPVVGARVGSDQSPQLDAMLLLSNSVRKLAAAYDTRHGGFGRAPKFPQPALLDMLLRLAATPLLGMEDEAKLALEMALGTLGAMAAGGIRDHLGGGFARYSTDATWLVPHFEKMAYDQAGLARAYLHAWQLTKEPLWLEIAEEILSYVTTVLSDPSGGIHSAEDADSEGEEGTCYLWSPEEFEQVLGPDVANQASLWWGVTSRGNFEGRSILSRPWPGDLQLPAALQEAKEELLQFRNRRPRPGRDDKVLTEWNAMILSTLAETAMASGEGRWKEAAEKIGDFLWNELRDSSGRWLRSWHNGQARHKAYAVDYAWLVDAFVRMGEVTGQAKWTQRAISVADDLLELFWDDEDGGFFTTGSDVPQLVVRAKEVLDGATPSANSASAFALRRLWALTGNDRYLQVSDAILARLVPLMEQAPSSMGWALAAFHMQAAAAIEIVVTGGRSDLVREAHRRFLPQAVLAWGEPFESPLWENREAEGAYVCRNYACALPASTVEQLAAQLD